jgi:hypothetical protein
MPTYNCVTAPDPICKHPADEDNFVLGFDDVLGTGQEIDSIDTALVEVVEGTDGSNTLEVSDEQATAADVVTDKGKTISAGRGVQFALLGGEPDVTYKVTLTVTTDTGAVRAGAVFVEVKE